MMRTELSMKGKVEGREHICKIEAHSAPKAVFGEFTAEELFEEKVGAKPESIVSISIRVSKELPFGATGFDYKR